MDASKLQTLYSLAGSRTAVGAPPPPIPWRHAASRTHPSLRARFPIQPAAPVSILLRRRQGRRPGALRRILYDMVLRVTTLTPYCLLRHKEHIAAYGEGNEGRLTGKNETADIHTFRWVSPTVARRSGSANEMEQNGKDYFRNGGAAVDGVGATEAVENDDERQVWFLFIHL